MAESTRGPQSYFPSIESKYGKPVGHWLALLDQCRDKAHMEMVNFLKENHGLSHGHANALVAYYRATSNP